MTYSAQKSVLKHFKSAHFRRLYDYFSGWVILLPVARSGTPGQHPLPDLAGAEPHLHRVVPQQGLQLQHHQFHQLRSILCPRADGIRRHGAADRRHLQHLSPQDRHCESLLLRILRRQVRHLSGAEAVGHGHAGQTGPHAASDPEILLRQQHRVWLNRITIRKRGPKRPSLFIFRILGCVGISQW